MSIELQAQMRGVVDEKGKMYIGCNVRRTGDGYTLDQREHIERVLKDNGYATAKPLSTPMTEPPKDDKEWDPKVKIPFELPSLIGSLHYIAQWSRPDISYAVNYLARHQRRPTEHTIATAKRVLRYLVGTVDLKIAYKSSIKSSPARVTTYVDASHAAEADRKSQTGGLIFYNGSLLNSGSHHQKCITTSAAEAELIAASDYSRRTLGVVRLLEDLKIPHETPVIREDNSAVVAITSGTPKSKSTLRHVQTHHLFVREQAQRGAIKVKHISGDRQVADLLTKPLPKGKFELLRNRILLG